MTSAFDFDKEGQDPINIYDRDDRLSVPEKFTNNKSIWSTELTQLTNEVLQNLHQAISEEEILTNTLEEAQRLLDCDRVVVYSLTEVSQGKIIAEAIVPGWTKILGMTIEDPCLESQYLDFYQNGRVKAIDNIYTSGIAPCYIEQLENLEVKASLVAPLFKDGKLFGFLLAHQCSQPRVWQSAEITFFSQLTTYAGFFLNNVKLLAESLQLKQQQEIETQWTQFFTDAVRHIRQSLQQQDIIDVSVEEVRRVLDCDRVVIYSLNRDNYGEVVAESVAVGWTRALGITIKDPCFEAKYLKEYENGRVRALDNIYEAEITSCYLEQLEKLAVKANLVTPIINEGKIFGLLVAHQCSSPRTWKQYEIRWAPINYDKVGQTWTKYPQFFGIE